MATIDLKLKSYDELQFEIMRLITDNHLKQQQIQELINNWNELKEWVKQQKKTEIVKIPVNMLVQQFKNGYYEAMCDIQDKMKKIEENNK